jgi:hypothetical protein
MGFIAIALLASAGRHSGGYEPVTSIPTVEPPSSGLTRHQLNHLIRLFKKRRYEEWRQEALYFHYKHKRELTNQGIYKLTDSAPADISFDNTGGRVAKLLYWTDPIVGPWHHEGFVSQQTDGRKADQPIETLVSATGTSGTGYSWSYAKTRYGLATITATGPVTLGLSFTFLSPGAKKDADFMFHVVVMDKNNLIVAADTKVVSVRDPAYIDQHPINSPQ